MSGKNITDNEKLIFNDSSSDESEIDVKKLVKIENKFKTFKIGKVIELEKRNKIEFNDNNNKIIKSDYFLNNERIGDLFIEITSLIQGFE